MSSIPVIAGGAAVDCKPSIIVGGVEVPIYDAYVAQGGQAIKVYQSAVEWTFVINQWSDNASSIRYGNSDTYSSYADVNAGDSGTAYCRCWVSYSFKTSLIIKAGQTITAHNTGLAPNNHIAFGVWLNPSTDEPTGSASIFGALSNTGAGDYSYTFSADMTLNKIVCYTEAYVGGNNNNSNIVSAVTVHSSDYGSFLLNNSGSSDQ